MPRTPAEKAKHAAAERKRYATLKRGLARGITALANNESVPRCSMPTGKRLKGKELICGREGPHEIDHRYGTRFRQRKMNSVQRLERFAIELIKYLGGDKRCELRLACRSCNAKHQPKRRTRR